jgi:hypothetical protein
MTTTPRRQTMRFEGLRLPRSYLFRSAPRRRVQPVASAAVDGFTGPGTDLDAAAHPGTNDGGDDALRHWDAF